MDGQDPGYGQGIPPPGQAHYSSMMPLGAPPPPLALSSSDVKYNLYDTGVSENKPFNDVNGMLQQIMSIVDQSLDEAQARFVFHRKKKVIIPCECIFQKTYI
jgi:hypothetical protein